MQNIQEIFDRMQKKKKEAKEIKKMYREGLDAEQKYKDIVAEIKVLRDKKKQIETNVQVDLGEAYDKLELMQNDIKADQEMINDIAMNTIMDGKQVEIVDEYNNRYEPEFKVSLKKSNQIRKEVIG
jgi:hypothetical protein